MALILLFVLALFVAIWQTIIFVGNALNKTLNTYSPFNILMYAVDIATPNGSYLGNFWDTEIDWDEGRKIEVLAYAELPTYISEYDLVEDNNG